MRGRKRLAILPVNQLWMHDKTSQRATYCLTRCREINKKPAGMLTEHVDMHDIENHMYVRGCVFEESDMS